MGTTSRYRLEQLIRGLSGGREVGRVAVNGPLVVRVLDTAGAQGFLLKLELGPLVVSRSGETSGIRVASGAGDTPARLAAELNLAATGHVARSRVLEQQSPELVGPILETLLSLDGPPSEAIGAGARWLRSGERIRSEYHLLSVTEELATYRVWRAQSPDAGGAAVARSIGEWSWSRRHWPPSGSDRMNLGAPAPDAPSIVVSFEVSPQGG